MEAAIVAVGENEEFSSEKPLVRKSDVENPEDLVSRAISPVKAEFLRPAPLRARLPPHDEGGGGYVGETEKNGSAVMSSAAVVKDRKSKRQIKRERQQEKNSAHYICSEVARTGNTDACQYGQRCRFSHDLEAFLAQKPTDLEGMCPFLDALEVCPFGVTCRFYNTHEERSNLVDNNSRKKNTEANLLNKDLQKLLWKNKVHYLKADAELKRLGLLKRDNSTPKSEGKQRNPFIPSTDICNSEMPVNVFSEEETTGVNNGQTDPLDDMKPISDSRPSKRPKSPVSIVSTINGISQSEIESEDLIVESTRNGIEFTAETDLSLKPHTRERKRIDFNGKLYLAPLTTVGNLPFRRICKSYGADITCGEMAMCTNLLQGQASEWALLKRHASEDFFGVQICGAYPDTIARAVELIERECTVDFIDINMGCPIDLVVNKGAGSCLLTKPMRMKGIIQAASATVDIPITVKVRTAYFEGRNKIHSLISDFYNWGASAITIHGRSRQQRYSKLANWDYIFECVKKAPSSLQVLGNGDIFSHCDWNRHASECPELSSCMIARGALIKPWIFTEIKERRHWDITSGERYQMLKDYVNFGLMHWGSDTKGVESTRHFLLEWLSYTHRYIPVGLLEIVPQRLNWRPPCYFGRNDLETLMASDSAVDWVRISEMLLGKVPQGFTFAPKHKSNAYDRAENG